MPIEEGLQFNVQGLLLSQLGRNLHYFVILGGSLTTIQIFLWVYLDTPIPVDSSDPSKVVSVTPSHFLGNSIAPHACPGIAWQVIWKIIEEELTSPNNNNNNN